MWSWKYETHSTLYCWSCAFARSVFLQFTSKDVDYRHTQREAEKRYGATPSNSLPVHSKHGKLSLWSHQTVWFTWLSPLLRKYCVLIMIMKFSRAASLPQRVIDQHWCSIDQCPDLLLTKQDYSVGSIQQGTIRQVITAVPNILKFELCHIWILFCIFQKLK